MTATLTDAPTLPDWFLDHLRDDPWNSWYGAADWLQDAGGWDWPNVLRHVLAWPDNDGLRLVAARWFEEAGEAERAEFVRVQVNLARTECSDMCHPYLRRPATCVCERRGLRLRERDLWLFRNLADVWLPAPPGTDYRVETGATFCGWLWYPKGEDRLWAVRGEVHRGFVESLALSAAAWLAHAARLTAAHPIREVMLTGGLDWYDDGGMAVLHDGRHPRAGDAARRTGVPAAGVGTAGDVLRLEWPRITFHLPPEPVAVLQRLRVAAIPFSFAFTEVAAGLAPALVTAADGVRLLGSAIADRLATGLSFRRPGGDWQYAGPASLTVKPAAMAGFDPAAGIDTSVTITGYSDPEPPPTAEEWDAAEAQIARAGAPATDRAARRLVLARRGRAGQFART